MKKVMCLLLCLLMVLPVTLLGCSTNILDSDPNATKAKTVTITTIREDGTTDEAIEMVQAALNSITENQFNTHVILHMIPAAEYEDYVYQRSERNFMNGIGAVEDDEEKEEEKTSEEEEETEIEFFEEDGVTYAYAANGDLMMYDQYNRAHTVYPNEKEDQLDIILIPNVKFYNKLLTGYVETVESTGGEIENSYLCEIGGRLNGIAGALLKKYVASYNLSALFQASRSGQTFAIPNNYYYGTYRYLVLNKEMVDKYQYDPKTLTSLGESCDYIYDLMENEDISPLYNYGGYSFLTYFDFPSMFGMRRANDFSFDGVLKLSDILSFGDYTRTLNLLNDLKKGGYQWIENEKIDPSELENESFGMAVLEGGPDIPDQLGDNYYTVLMERPALTSEMFSGMYAISDGCEDPDRALEILTQFSTNETIVNLLAYGLEGAHYELSNSGMVVNRSKDYSMNLRYVGNAFLLKQNEDMDEELLKYSADGWALAKTHNRGLALDPYCGFSIRMNDELEQLVADFKEISDSVLARFDKYDEFVASNEYQTYMESEEHTNYVEKNGTDPNELPYLEYLSMLKNIFERSAPYKEIIKTGVEVIENTPFQQYSDYFFKTYRAAG